MNRALVWRILDAVLAGVLLAVALTEIWLPLASAEGTGSRELSSFAAIVLCLPLALRRRWPLPVALVVLLAWPIIFSIQPVLVLFWGQLVPIVVATYSVARHGSRLHGYFGGAAAAACLLFFDLRVENLQAVEEIVFHWLVVSLAWLTGKAVSGAERRAAESRRLAVEIETESRTRMIAAISDERARIARELHDIVAHAVTVMVVQAGAAEQVVTDDPAYVKSALATIRSTGTDALTDMRRVVSMLRDDSELDELSPQPGLGRLDAIIEDARASGLDVSLTIEGRAIPLAPGLDLAAFRIVQEALTNVRKHSDANRADIVVRYTSDAVELSVIDDGTSEARASRASSGHGIIGMRERAALYGGTLEAARTTSGFAVRAALPVSA